MKLRTLLKSLRVITLISLAFLSISGPTFANDAAKFLRNADGIIAKCDSVRGQFHYERRIGDQIDLQLKGSFRVWKEQGSLPNFDIIYRDQNDRMVKRIWSQDSVIYCRVEGEEAVKSSVFRGGIQLMSKYSNGVASHYTQPDSFTKLIAYRPTLVPLVGSQTETRQIEVASPQKKWRYSFSSESNQLESLLIKGKVDDQEVLETTRYSQLRYDLSARKSVPSFPDVEFAEVGVASELIGKDLSDIEVTFASNKKGKLAGLRGKVVVIDFWATWCGPCLTSIPGLETLSKEYSTDEVEFMLVPWNDSPTSAKAFAEKRGFGIDQYLIDQDNVKAFLLDQTGIPAVFILDQNGQVVDMLIGSFGDLGKAHLRSIIEKQLRSK